MGLIDIPSYVLAGEPPPHHRTKTRAFHLLTWELPAPIEFPREVFADALAVHARLLDENGDDLLAAPVIEDGEADFFALRSGEHTLLVNKRRVRDVRLDTA